MFMRVVCAIAVVLSAAARAVAEEQKQPPAWAQLPKMQLERQFAGPLQDTVIQRWRDPIDGTVCYLYLPISAAHSPPTPSGYVQYGANTIGSMSCQPGAHPGPTPASTKRAPARAAPAPPPASITPPATKND